MSQSSPPLSADYYHQEMMSKYRAIIRSIKHATKSEKNEIRRAFDFGRQAHEGMRRKSGEPFFMHPLEVARIVVVEMGLEDTTSVIAAFLHDVVEDTDVELSDIRREFGVKAAEIIDGLTKISGQTNFEKMDSKQAENFRKILLTISNDIRVVLIKLADRLHNMRTLSSMRTESMLRNTSETLYIYAPLAHRLGLYEIKTELEDLAFKFSQPAIYQGIEEKLTASRDKAEEYIERFIKGIRKALRNLGLKYTVKSRFKTIYSIHNKMVRKNLPFEEIYDKYAVRIILETRPGMEKEDCWKVYSLISEIYRPNPKRVRDWITVAKDNGYESLHTTLMGPEGRWVEVQIRTTRMDQVAEKGIAAHWKYKENGELADENLTEWIAHIRDILQNPNLNALEAVREFRANLEPNDVFVFTPKGEMVRLPSRSTVLDLAYKIHTDVGNTAIGAKVNNQVVTLEEVLRPGDQVEILTSRKGYPRREWLRFVRTSRARDQIRNAMRKQQKEAIEQGRQLFYWRARQYGVDEHHPIMKELLAYFMKPTMEDFFFDLGMKRVESKRISEFIQMKKEGRELDKAHFEAWERKQRNRTARYEDLGVNPDLLVLGKEHNIDNHVLARCCNPLPGDDVLGFDEGDRVVIHRTGCEKAITLMSNFSSNIIRAKWAEGQADVEFLAGLKVVGIDKQGMLNDLIRIISLRMKINIRKVTIESQEGMFEGLFHLYVPNTRILDELIRRIESLPNVYTVGRYDGNQMESAGIAGVLDDEVMP
ncbi:MAG: bifunctional (p)ppGpp synthetase/guanosine-3',5'-bis(diphosphate) 3'-pyrophosphohydrolase [Bacteroidetes bacterium]|nr:MAG: bifunctional (p)ppGpp synthetase/guanosine-3',5'-bis(diphosphate) 3'-pyrophosphohydrolase [Bacteroidota bacterium]